MDGTTPSMVTPAACTNSPNGRPWGLPCSSAIVAPFSSAVKWRQGKGWAGMMWLASQILSSVCSTLNALAPYQQPAPCPGSSHLPANTSQGPNIQPMLVGQHTTSPRRTSWWKKAFAAHRSGVVCDQGMALGSPAACGGKKDDNRRSATPRRPSALLDQRGRWGSHGAAAAGACLWCQMRRARWQGRLLLPHVPVPFVAVAQPPGSPAS